MTLAHLPTGMIIYLRKKVPAVNHRVVTLDDAITRGEGVQKGPAMIIFAQIASHVSNFVIVTLELWK